MTLNFLKQSLFILSLITLTVSQSLAMSHEEEDKGKNSPLQIVKALKEIEQELDGFETALKATEPTKYNIFDHFNSRRTIKSILVAGTPVLETLANIDPKTVPLENFLKEQIKKGMEFTKIDTIPALAFSRSWTPVSTNPKEHEEIKAEAKRIFDEEWEKFFTFLTFKGHKERVVQFKVCLLLRAKPGYFGPNYVPAPMFAKEEEEFSKLLATFKMEATDSDYLYPRSEETIYEEVEDKYPVLKAMKNFKKSVRTLASLIKLY